MASHASRQKTIAADHSVIDQYYSLLEDYRQQRVRHEGEVSNAFEIF